MICAHVPARSAYSESARDRQICAHWVRRVSRRRYGCDVSSEQSRSGLDEEAASRIQVLVDEREYGGFTSLALEHDPPAVVLFWKGPLPQPVEELWISCA